jgi:hypothetical protein
MQALTLIGVIGSVQAFIYLLVRDGWRGFRHPRGASDDAAWAPPGNQGRGWRASLWMGRALRHFYRFQLLGGVACLFVVGAWWLLSR